MDKRDIFFGDKGLTSTSANHVANMAKEFIQVKSAMVEHLRFVGRKMTVVAAQPGTPMEVSNGMTADQLPQVSQALDDIYQAKALIAWLREGIKAREQLMTETRNTTLERYCELQHTAVPQEPKPEKPMTEDDYYASLPLGDRVRYYRLETKCAVIGKAIHPDGALSVARKELINSVADPSRLVVKNGTTFVEQVEPSVQPSEIDAFFFGLQQRHREAQAELNAIKWGCEKAVQADAIAKSTAYNEALQAFNAQLAKLSSEMNLWQRKRIAELGSKKIIIPEALAGIYEKVNGLGK